MTLSIYNLILKVLCLCYQPELSLSLIFKASEQLSVNWTVTAYHYIQ